MNKMGEARKAEVSETEALLQTAIKELIKCARELDQYGSLESAARADKVIASIRAAELSAQDASPKDGWQRDAARYRKARKMRLRLDADSIVPVRPDKFDAMIDAAPEPSSANDRAMAHYDE
jgi:predicted glycosyl hydrolase (DUF1957 family)